MPLHLFYIGLLLLILASPVAAAGTRDSRTALVAWGTVGGLSLIAYGLLGLPGLRLTVPQDTVFVLYRSAACAELAIASCVPLLALASTKQCPTKPRSPWTRLPTGVLAATLAAALSDLVGLTHIATSSISGVIIVPLGGLRLAAGVFLATWHSIASASVTLISASALAIDGAKRGPHNVALAGALSASLVLASFLTRVYP